MVVRTGSWTMQRSHYRYVFDKSVSMSAVEETLHLAILGAESLFGESTVRMDATYSIDEAGHVCSVDASSEVGRSICRIFTGYVTREFGESAFCVRAASPGPMAEVAPSATA
jgi:hypothetical protein